MIDEQWSKKERKMMMNLVECNERKRLNPSKNCVD